LKKPPLVILSPSLAVTLSEAKSLRPALRVNSAENLRDDDSTRVRRPFTSFRVT